jgi:hypothetical protein
VAKKMKAWDVMQSKLIALMMGPEFKDSNPHDGLDFNDKLDDKPLSKYVVPKIATKVQEWSKDSIQPISTHIRGVKTRSTSAKN